MTLKHIVQLYTDPTLIGQENDETYANIFWSVQFNRDLDAYFSKRKYQHDFDLFKEGYGRLKIRFTYDSDASPEENLAYVETLAAKHLVSNSGLNVFGFTNDKVTIRRDQLHFVVSQPDTVSLIDRKGVDQSVFSRLGKISAKSSPAAAYLFGATAEPLVDISWAEPLKDENYQFDFYNTILDLDARENDYVFTPMGDIIVDYRSVEELMNSEWMQFQITVKGMEIARPFDMMVDLVNKANEVIYEDNKYLDKIRQKFGEDCFLLLNREQKTWLPIKPVTHNLKDVFHVLGLRRYYTPLRLAEMHEHGFALNIEQKLSEEELKQLKETYEQQNAARAKTKKQKSH
ncbi:hypothetical protein [Vibrio sp.]|uniref:hypothetical protein n=1 Tax=Vibrio sp. TaxID=678 RepID=UPI003D1307E4